jgi:voltage-gated potassium channel
MSSRRRLGLSIALFAGVFVVGVAGFKILGGPGWSLLDAVYQTVITVATVGYGEAHDLGGNPAARVFEILYIILSLGTIAFAVSSITAFIVEGELKRLLGRRRMDKDIARLKDHDIVCGSDETAQTIIQELLATARPFVVIEPAAERLEKLAALGPVLYLQGDPAEDDVLLKAGIERARGVLLSLPTDEANLFVAVTARSLNPKVRIVAKGIDVKSHAKMMKAGADYVVSPSYIGGMRMVSQLIRPAAVTFLDLMLRERGATLRVEDVFVAAGAPLAGKTVGASGLRDLREALLVAIKRAGTGEHVFNPGPEAVIGAGDALIFITSPAALGEIARQAGGPHGA